MSGFAPTPEQEQALRLFSTGKSLAIEAGAGTGKTSTLLLLAASTTRRGQIVAFNRAIIEDVKATLAARRISNVRANTAHSLAFAPVGSRYKHRLNSHRQQSWELAERLGTEQIAVEYHGERKVISKTFLASHVMRALNVFCSTADEAPSAKHVPYIDGIDDVAPGGKRSYFNNDQVAARLEPILRRGWADLTNLQGALPFSHGVYLKLWQLSSPRIGADFIMFDECQDANPVLRAIVAAQDHAQVVWVGDSQQSIYEFTGAVNALAEIRSSGIDTTFLTQSFRFGPAIATVANHVLGALQADLRLTGTETIPSRVEAVPEPDAILTRTNAAAVRAVITALADDKKVHLVGGSGEITAFMRAAQRLMNGDRPDHPELACFATWAEVQDYVLNDPQGDDLRLMVDLIEEFGVAEILEALDRGSEEKDADLIVSTAHKAKGREWSRVRLADDFPEEAHDEELRLLYVACTRAKLILDVTGVKWFTLNGNGHAEHASVPVPVASDSSPSDEESKTEVPAGAARSPLAGQACCQGCGAASEFPVTSCASCALPEAVAAVEAPAAQYGEYTVTVALRVVASSSEEALASARSELNGLGYRLGVAAPGWQAD